MLCDDVANAQHAVTNGIIRQERCKDKQQIRVYINPYDMGCGLKKTNSWGLSVSCMEGESVSLSQCKMKAHFVKFNCQTITCTNNLVTDYQISNLSVRWQLFSMVRSGLD